MCTRRQEEGKFTLPGRRYVGPGGWPTSMSEEGRVRL